MTSRSGHKDLSFADLTTEQQEHALAALERITASLIGDAIAGNFQAVRENALFDLGANFRAGHLPHRIK